MKALATLWDALCTTYGRGVMLFVLAPITVVLVIVPEFVQHIVEIQNNMFDSSEAARAFANAPLRWQFGGVKLAGLALAFIATARFWWTRAQGGQWWSLRGIGWGRLVIGLLGGFLIPGTPALLAAAIPEAVVQAAGLILSIVTLPFFFVLLSGLFGDASIPLKRFFTRGWLWVPLLLILLVAAFLPAQLLHGQLHHFALGQARALIWALMAVDALVVGLLAGLTGSAFFTGYDYAVRDLARR